MVPVHMRYAPSASTCLILRTIIYLADAPPSAWAQLAGVPHDTSAPVSFILLADPTYSSMEELMNGLDYAYPQANKIGNTACHSKCTWSSGLYHLCYGQCTGCLYEKRGLSTAHASAWHTCLGTASNRHQCPIAWGSLPAAWGGVL